MFHHIEIEAGRWTRPRTPVNERLCNTCNCLEDEYHFVIECCLYNSLRRKYIDQIYRVRPNMYKFVNLITSDNTRTINNLAIYVHKAFKVRNTAFFLVIILNESSLCIEYSGHCFYSVILYPVKIQFPYHNRYHKATFSCK